MEYAESFLTVQGKKIGGRCLVKAKIKTEGFADLIESYKRKGGNVDRLVRRALLSSAIETQKEINKSANNYIQTGAMVQSEIKPQIEKAGVYAYRCKVGFQNDGIGGEHAILLNYGTPKKKQGKTIKGMRFLTNAIRRSSRRRKDIMTIQMLKDIEKL